MKGLKDKGEVMTTPLKTSEVDEILQRYEESRGRDKGRIKFSYVTN